MPASMCHFEIIINNNGSAVQIWSFEIIYRQLNIKINDCINWKKGFSSRSDYKTVLDATTKMQE